MNEKYFKAVILGIFLFVVMLIQVTVNGGLPLWLRHTNLILTAIIIILIMLGFRAAAWASLFFGLFLDYFSFRVFGVYTLSLFLSAAAADFILVNWLTNRSIYSFIALAALTVTGYNFLLYFLFYFSEVLFKDLDFFVFSGNFWLGLSLEVFSSCLLVFLFFFYHNSTTNRWRPFFLKGTDSRR